ncbi:MAG: nickel-dependent lactate racemase [Thermodesulfobacteriota bacterium]|nr:nickel-dependent lactate racemase [Thermodesulfobacteriota bacterium]
MSQKVLLKYGKEEFQFKLPDHDRIYEINKSDANITPAEFKSRLEGELERLRPDFSDVAIVVADKTRLCGYPLLLPVLIETLKAFGAKTDNISLYIAYGTHMRQTDDESYALYGDTYKNYTFVHHDCRDHALFKKLGETKRGTPVYIRRDILDSSFIITFGAVSHHYFAGYGGGRKLIFPGLGRLEAIYKNHGLFLDRQNRTLSLSCMPGVLDGNPLAEDLAEYETFCPADLSIHGIIDRRGNVSDLLVGSGKGHFQKACTEHGKNCEIVTDKNYDLVIASCGGYPKDINFIQSHKALHHAAMFVNDGGNLIVLAECHDGIGSKTFLPWFEIGTWERAFDRLAKNYAGNGGTALSMMSKLRRINIGVVTQLNNDVCQTIGVNKITMSRAKHDIESCSGSIAAITHAGLLVKRVSIL